MTSEKYFFELDGKTKSVTRSPNQRLIHIHLRCEGGYGSVNYTAHIKARKGLSKNAFELYDYLEFHHNDIIWSLSSKHLYSETQLTETTYAKAFNELVSKGYLVKKPITATTVPVTVNAYHFYEDPSIGYKYTETTY